MRRDAKFSKDRKRRFNLIRDWRDEGVSKKLLTVNFIMLNPSVADEFEDDRTVCKCVEFGRRWGFTRAVITNLIPIVSTDPSRLPPRRGMDVENKAFLLRWIKRADLIVAAWGGQPTALARKIELMEHVRLLRSLSAVQFYCIGTTKGGAPRHPSRAKYTKRPQRTDIAM